MKGPFRVVYFYAFELSKALVWSKSGNGQVYMTTPPRVIGQIREYLQRPIMIMYEYSW